ncbi:NAD-binding protein [Lentzea tibetensis]|uniref:NAD-binding protein n=1 Tax=Lentzea tibetensis TaxID=2591470 RepID=A0A563EUB5_9PSEU|nr:NmrA family NAD(P)-binding protein [Lentzea tibetensis]TWP51269.1 NAD-binding protein [Lentzea tibetensis]
MAKIVVFGAGGQAGRPLVAQADERGHEVTAIGRDPGVGEAATLAAGYDVAISAVYDSSADPAEFYTAAARALVASGVRRVIVVGIYPLLEVSPGVRLVDSADFPAEHKPFCLGHAAGVDVLRSSSADWLVMSPAGQFGGAFAGAHAIGPVDPADSLSYEDFAVAVLDEVERPAHSRTQIGVRSASA